MHPRILQPDSDHALEEFLFSADKLFYCLIFSLVFSFVALAICFLLAVAGAA